MGGRSERVRGLARFAGEVVAETLWPTRCALCDAPGAVLCASCARALPVLDWWTACPRCGQPFGLVQCDLCSPLGLERIGREHLPFAAAASAVRFDAATGTLVRVYKDQGERRLAADLARFMARVVSPGWRFDAVTFVPATKAAVRARGFDHAELLAHHVAAQLGAECRATFDRPRIRDQRALTGRQRLANLSGAFVAHPASAANRRFLLIDDVLTTGSTLCAATDALKTAGATQIYALTFARV